MALSHLKKGSQINSFHISEWEISKYHLIKKKKSFISGWGGGKTTLKKRGNSRIRMWRNMKLRDQSISGVHGRIHWKSSVTELFCSRGIPELGNSIRMKKVHQNINHWREIARRVTFEFHSKIIETFLRIGS